MKHTFKHVLTAVLLTIATLSLNAQEVATTNMLEMAPYRHQINPAFEPLTDGYFYFPVFSHMQFYAGQNSLTMSDIIFKQNGTTMWALNPASEKDLMSAFRKTTLFRGDVNMAILGFGFRVKEKGYVHVNIDANLDAGVGLPKGLFSFLLGGGMTDLTGMNTYDLSGLGLRAQGYLSLALGYSHRQTDQWTWGAKLKVLDGLAYADMRQKDLALKASPEQWSIKGNGYATIAGPFPTMPASANYEDIQNWIDGGMMPDFSDISSLLKPSGIGLAFDLGATYQPHEMVKVSLSLTDLGAIYWMRGQRYNYAVDMTYDGLGQLQYSDYVDDEGHFDSNRLTDTITTRLTNIYQHGLVAGDSKTGVFAPLTMKLNAGVDAYFCNNIIGLGLYSRTMLYNAKLYEELTLGAALRPCSWFNFAVSYSMINGKWGNLGTAIGLRGGPFALTLAADYVPMSWSKIPNGEKTIPVPYKTPGVNMELGINIVWGWKQKKDKDKDGVLDKFDMCPGTPRDVRVDELGCPLDTDGDGVPDYLDECPGTPVAAYGLIDEKGCPFDTDGDGVPDYLDECPKTDSIVWGHVDEKGCALDSDGDGVEDYRDECPNTPAAAIGHVDEKGCELDSDGDGVPDYMDECPNTPEEAYATITENGCPLDTDGDGVADYLDECPGTPKEAIGHVDEKGCELDTDGDGVPDYLDKCPEIPGTKDNHGCPEMKREVTNVFKKAMQGIQFETGKSIIKKSSYGILDKVADVFLENPTYNAEVQGHTDNVGKPEANKKLSQARAEAVREYLIKKGVAAERLTAVGYGDERPIAPNTTSAGRTQNRRVEFDVEYKETIIETVQP